METHNMESTLARRMGKTVHVSPLRFRLLRLFRSHPAEGATCLEDWLVDLANARGARIVERPRSRGFPAGPPGRDAVSDEELVVALCQLQCLDRPQILRLPAQMISRGRLDMKSLVRTALRERAGFVLAELARLALKVDPAHPGWGQIVVAFANEPKPPEPMLHWSRLARAKPVNGRYNVESWSLVA